MADLRARWIRSRNARPVRGQVSDPYNPSEVLGVEDIRQMSLSRWTSPSLEKYIQWQIRGGGGVQPPCWKLFLSSFPIQLQLNRPCPPPTPLIHNPPLSVTPRWRRAGSTPDRGLLGDLSLVRMSEWVSEWVGVNAVSSTETIITATTLWWWRRNGIIIML